MKRFITVVSGLILIGCLSSLFAAKQTAVAQQTVTPINSVAAIVNNQVITESDLAHQTAIVRHQLESSHQPVPNATVLRRNVLQQMIDVKLQLQVAKKSGIRVSNVELTDAMNKIASQNHMTLSQLYAASQAQGLSIQDFRDQIRTQITLQKLQQQAVASRISINEQEVNDYLRSNPSSVIPEYHLANILIPLSSEPSPEEISKARSKAERLIQKLNKGANFNKLAASESSGSDALQGGDLGWRKLPELPVVFAKKAKTMRVGQVAGPIQTPNGFHIIKLVAARNLGANQSLLEFELQEIILNKSSKSDDAALLNQLASLRTEAMKGYDFKKLAKSNSQDKKTAKLGGYVGWVKPSDLSSDVYHAIKNLKADEVSEPVCDEHACYLMKVVAKREAAKSSEARKKEVEQLIFQRKLQENLQTFINELRNQSYVKVF